ncbi:S8 family serine peptidase [Saccharopolyspora sp. K220]|uniref:S8 family serine peptidase n=1 Tax=Saccharopolyspora soli TaxID=2926618 RepID=UPI001F561370|nr:S8 family serine peptidase [Saccharopolyspora soli]MCI2420582.1 S8 family serine peptidase [Saccharopolyspora soli]
MTEQTNRSGAANGSSTDAQASAEQRGGQQAKQKGGQQARGRKSRPARDNGRVEPRRDRYMVAAVPQRELPPGVAAISMDTLCDALERRNGSGTVLKRLRPAAKINGALAAPTCPEIVVIEATAEQAKALESTQVHVERDWSLTYSAPTPGVDGLFLHDPSMIVPLGEDITNLPFRVTDDDGKPVAGACVYLLGASWPTQAVTDREGRATITLTGDTAEQVQAVYVKPAGQHWDRWLVRPALTSTDDNLITLTPLGNTFPDLSERQHLSWGHSALGLDRVPPTFRAYGVRIATIDSGVDTEHPDLKGRIRSGLNFVWGKERDWAHDPVGHGTHCAGIIAGLDSESGIVGIAVDAELDSCRVLPGGRASDLIAALDRCIEQSIDIAHLAVASPNTSTLVARKLLDAYNAGIACIAPAGDTAGPVAFPANLPTVFTVGALGALRTYPADTSHATHPAMPVTPDGLYSAGFSAAGPEIDVCAPGVAVLSAAPGNGYAVLDGTSLAAAHIAGLAALVLAHHEHFRGQLPMHGAARVEHLFDILRASCRPLAAPGSPDALRTGRGIPDAPTALGLTLGAFAPPTTTPLTTTQ